MKIHTKGYANALIRKITWVYGIFLVLIGLLASYMAYDKESTALETELTQAMSDLSYAYENSTDDFWRYYVPIVENESGIYDALKEYFQSEDREHLTQMEKFELTAAMQKLMAYNHGVSWVGLYTGREDTNYMMFNGETMLQVMPEDFAFIDDMDKKEASMEVYGSKEIFNNGQIMRTFALCGNASINVDEGKIIFGYETNEVYSAFENTVEIENANFYIVNDYGIVFDSAGVYDESIRTLAQSEEELIHADGALMRVYRLENTGSRYRVFCTIPQWEELMVGHTYSPYILAIVILFWICSLLVYRWTGRSILKKIRAIQTGLHMIGENKLDHRIPVSKTPKDEFEDIGRSINEMTAQLQENINKAYELRLQQRETELSELQAKFDPHFLYNTLEVIRGRVYENGDMETSDVIIKMAQLFRNLLNSENFISIRDEIDFCNSYLSLMEYRYDDRIDIIYDVESEVMQYGIIRNLLQPVLENFFVHGIDEDKYKHTLRIRGKVYDEEYIWFYIQNDGLTIPEEKLNKLISSLKQTGEMSQGYGLQNVQRRTKLFYGPDCGLTLRNNPTGGVTVELKIRKLTFEEHKQRLNNG